MSQVQAEKVTTVCADECCAPRALVLPPKSTEREALIREAFKLEWLTIGWMSVEAIVALASGLAAGSLVLVAFGLDSVIELASAGALVWRLTVELRRGQAFSVNAERLASQIAGGLLFAGRLRHECGPLEPMDETRGSVLMAGLHRRFGGDSIDALSGPSQDRDSE